MNKLKISLLAIALLSATGCATMFTDSSNMIIVRSMDGTAGVKVEITSSRGTYLAKLPTTIVAKPSNRDVVVKLVDKRYVPITKIVYKTITAAYWYNFLFLPGFLIDWGVESMWEDNSKIYIPVIKKQKVIP